MLQLYEKLMDLIKKENLLDGTLFWTISEQRVKDADRVKGFRYAVCFHVKGEEPYYTEEEIQAEIAHVRQQMEAQREEFFTEEPEEDE